jgi:transcriptional regulator with XRE-family HTH domain
MGDMGTETLTRAGRKVARPYRWQPLWRIMERDRISVEELAVRTGKARTTIYAYLRGEVTPGVAEVASIARALNVPEGELRDGDYLPIIFLPAQ